MRIGAVFNTVVGFCLVQMTGTLIVPDQYQCYSCKNCDTVNDNTPKCYTIKGCITVLPNQYEGYVQNLTIRNCFEKYEINTATMYVDAVNTCKKAKKFHLTSLCMDCYSDECNGVDRNFWEEKYLKRQSKVSSKGAERGREHRKLNDTVENSKNRSYPRRSSALLLSLMMMSAVLIC